MAEIKKAKGEKRPKEKLIQVQVGLSSQVKQALAQKCEELGQTEAALGRMLIVQGLREMGAIG
ncbi:hypothetical protein [Lonepinella koalarum]|uniref:hypothetical protein n=1 Tax=Lonepinella koalarum TaxID=53417 RepID=UPI003F6DE593